MKKLLSALAILLFLLSSCLKDDALDEQLSMDEAGGMSVLAVFNLVESSQRLEVFLDNNLHNRGESLRYGDVIRHRTVFPGKRTLATTVYYGNRQQKTAPREIALDREKNYSLFLYGNNAHGMLLVEDDLILPASGKFKVRFANFNSAQDATNIGNATGAGRYFSSTKPNQVTDFVELDMDENSFLLSKDSRGTNALPIKLNPANRGVYTVLVIAPHIGANAEANTQSLYKVIQHP